MICVGLVHELEQQGIAPIMDDLRNRLRRLGVVPASEHTRQPIDRPRQPGPKIEELVQGGRVVETAGGECFVVERRFDLQTMHGLHALSSWTACNSVVLAQIGRDPALGSVDPRSLVFLDTETTGLAGGAGTLVFLVGIGLFIEDSFAVQQFFLRDPAEETALLTVLNEALSERDGLVTFNGRAFDVPLLSTRYVLVRRSPAFAASPHLDLLPAARKLWRRRLNSCALHALEGEILGLHRSATDVPGHLIPFLYRHYLSTGDATPMTRILYHNEIDILSMVTLGITLHDAFRQPDSMMLTADEHLSLGRWYEEQGMIAESERAYHAAIDNAETEETLHDALAGLAYLLKRRNRSSEAVRLWESLAALGQDTIGHQELAKHHEWRTRDLSLALDWTESALEMIQDSHLAAERAALRGELEHRRARLLRKLANLSDG